ncbi:MAG: ribonuclease H-like domain-containing protein [Clostridia bacterium]|nr:ribonuclease H-like domain-containing protein [Clostridia bacterium]
MTSCKKQPIRKDKAGERMSSGLRAKLDRMKSPQNAAQPERAEPARATGLIVRVTRQSIDARIHALPPVGLRRIGWSSGPFDIKRCLFIDTETTGLSGGAGTVVFLIGAGYVDGDEFIIEQLLMREYADEPMLLERLGQIMSRFDCVCTFNGRNFDMPLIRSRFTMCRMRELWRDLSNIDLLYPSRRAWKLRIGSCRLSNIEAEILDMPRTDDIPGSEVPTRYFTFLDTGDESLLEGIIEHNRQDIATLAVLLIRLCDIYSSLEKLKDQRDLFSMGRSLEVQGELKAAREIYHITALPRTRGTLAALTGERIAGMANWRQYHILRRSGEIEGAIQVLKQMLQRRQMQGNACIALSKLYEHRLKDYTQALMYARMAIGQRDADPAEMIERRIQRLERKIADLEG